jgi:hypothetical protein
MTTGNQQDTNVLTCSHGDDMVTEDREVVMTEKETAARKGERYTFYLPTGLADKFEKARAKAFPGAPYKFVFEKLVERLIKENE